MARIMIGEWHATPSMTPTFSGTFAFLLGVRGAAPLSPVRPGPATTAWITTLLGSPTPGLSRMMATTAGVLFPVRLAPPHISIDLVTHQGDAYHMLTEEQDSMLSWCC